MYAVVKAGGHQYRVKEGDEVVVDFSPGKAGDTLKWDQVLAIGGANAVFGAPLVAGASVEVTIKEQRRLPKVIVATFKRRKNFKRTYGHKQPVTVVTVKKIKGA